MLVEWVGLEQPTSKHLVTLTRALAAALQVPLQEIQVSVSTSGSLTCHSLWVLGMMLLILLRYPATWRQMLLMRDVLWRDYPLQHFTLQKSSEASKSLRNVKTFWNGDGRWWMHLKRDLMDLALDASARYNWCSVRARWWLRTAESYKLPPLTAVTGNTFSLAHASTYWYRLWVPGRCLEPPRLGIRCFRWDFFMAVKSRDYWRADSIQTSHPLSSAWCVIFCMIHHDSS